MCGSGGTACSWQDLHSQEAGSLPQLDRTGDQRYAWYGYRTLCFESPVPELHWLWAVMQYVVVIIVFNVGEYRRNALGASKTYDFFHPENKDAVEARK